MWIKSNTISLHTNNKNNLEHIKCNFQYKTYLYSYSNCISYTL